MKKLNIWHRLGFVISITWFCASSFYFASSHANANYKIAGLQFNRCLEGAHLNASGKVSCADEYQLTIKRLNSNLWVNAATLAAIPIPLGWAFAYLVLWTIRWIVAGRR